MKKPFIRKQAIVVADEDAYTSNKIPVFKGNIQMNFASIKAAEAHFAGRILPDFDRYRAADLTEEEYLVSYGSYRMDCPEEDGDLSCAGRKAMSQFAIIVPEYTYVGRGEHVIVSPTMKQLCFGEPGPEVTGDINDRDALADIIQEIRRGSQEDFIKLMTKPKTENGGRTASIKSRSIVPRRENRFYCNVWGGINNEWSPTVFRNSHMSYTDLRSMANEYRPISSTPRYSKDVDPIYAEAEEFILGDFTHPLTGLKFDLKKTKKEDRTFLKFFFGNNGVDLTNCTEVPVPSEILKKRVDLYDIDNWNILPYKDLVKLLVEETEIPMDVINRACGHYVTVPTRTNPVHIDMPPASQPSDAVTSMGQGSGPSTTQTQQPPATSLAPPVEEEEQIPMNHDNDPVSVVKDGEAVNTTRGEVQKLVDSGEDPMIFIADGSMSNWAKASETGFKPAPVKDEQTSPLPNVPAVPSTPPLPETNSSPVSQEEKDVATNPEQSDKQLSADEEEELAELERLRAMAMDPAQSNKLTAQNIVRLTELIKRYK